MGHGSPGARQGRRQHYLVAFQDALAQGEQPPCAPTLQPIHEVPAQERLHSQEATFRP